MRFENFSFGSIRIDGTTYDHDVVIDRGEIHKRKKKRSKKFRDAFSARPDRAGVVKLAAPEALVEITDMARR